MQNQCGEINKQINLHIDTSPSTFHTIRRTINSRNDLISTRTRSKRKQTILSSNRRRKCPRNTVSVVPQRKRVYVAKHGVINFSSGELPATSDGLSRAKPHARVSLLTRTPLSLLVRFLNFRFTISREQRPAVNVLQWRFRPSRRNSAVIERACVYLQGEMSCSFEVFV